MKTVSYNDPYEMYPVVVKIDEMHPEDMARLIAIMNDDARQIRNLEKREQRHTAYHIEGILYEGNELASDEDVADKVARDEMERFIDEWLRENLTPVQYRRFVLFMDGLTIREVARCEGIDYSSANESIKASQKKLKKVLKNAPSKHPFKCPYSEED